MSRNVVVFWGKRRPNEQNDHNNNVDNITVNPAVVTNKRTHCLTSKVKQEIIISKLIMTVSDTFMMRLQLLMLMLMLLLLPLCSGFTFKNHLYCPHPTTSSSSTTTSLSVLPSSRKLQTDITIPLLDLVDEDDSDNDNDIDDTGGDAATTKVIVPLPSKFLPDQLSTPFLFGMQVDRPLYKLLVEEAIDIASKENWSDLQQNFLALSDENNNDGGGGGGEEEILRKLVAEMTDSDVDLDLEDGDDNNDDDNDNSNSGPMSSMLPQMLMKEAKRPMYGNLIWKDTTNPDTLVGAIGCTTEILVHNLSSKNKNHTDDGDEEGLDQDSGSVVSPVPPNTILGRGGFRFRVKEVVKTIPFPVAVVDEIQDDTNDDDSDMFATVSRGNDDDDDDDGDDDDDDDDDGLSELETPQLIAQIMRGVQTILKERLDEAEAKTRLSPLEKSILEDSQRLMGGSGDDDDDDGSNTKGPPPLNMAEIELAHAEEMVAVYEVFQLALVDDIEPQDRRFAVAIMASELADLNNKVRKEILLTRNGVERLRIVLREVRELAGMAQARKMAETITEKVTDDQKDLKVGVPQLPPWAKQIKRGTRVEYFWNEEFGWCGGQVIEDPVTIVDEILLTIRFDDGETHKIPLAAEDKIRWRPG